MLHLRKHVLQRALDEAMSLLGAKFCINTHHIHPRINPNIVSQKTKKNETGRELLKTGRNTKHNIKIQKQCRQNEIYGRQHIYVRKDEKEPKDDKRRDLQIQNQYHVPKREKPIQPKYQLPEHIVATRGPQ